MGLDNRARVLQTRLRANPEYELIPLDHLGSGEQPVLASLRYDPDCYGILRPRNSAALSIKAVSRDTARLLATLSRPMFLPRDAVSQLGKDCEPVLCAMIADGILEVEVEGHMITGPAAYYATVGEPQPHLASGVLSKLSRRAIEYAAALSISDIEILAARLYSYNRIPITREWKQRLPDVAAVETYLGLNCASIARVLAHHWSRVSKDPANDSWISFRSFRRRAPVGEIHKLYVSVPAEALAEAIAVVVPILSAYEVFHWKVGASGAGLLRPDKMVLYACSAKALRNVAAELSAGLSPLPAHGVPFTASLDLNGALSWGVDPAVQESRGYPWLEGESWRMRVCRRLASALIAGKRARDLRVSPLIYALDRVRLERIDTNTWAPLTSV